MTGADKSNGRASYSSHVMLGDEVHVGSDDLVVAVVTGLMFREHGYHVEVVWWDGRTLREQRVAASLIRLKKDGEATV